MELQNKYILQAFEVEDINTRQNFTFKYNPYDESVTTIDTTINKPSKVIIFYNKDFPFECKSAYDYFVYLYNKSLTHKDNTNIFFIGWVNPSNYLPIDEYEFKLPYEGIIKNRLNEINNDLLDLITDNNIKDIILENTYISGGCIASLIKEEEMHDYDYFFKNKESLNIVKNYFETIYDNTREIEVPKHNGCTKTKLLSKGFYSDKELLVTDNAITIGRYQLILKDYGQSQEVCSKFDFIHGMCSYDILNNELFIDKFTYDNIQSGYLIYNNSSDTPITSFYRMNKFLQRGWRIDRKEQAKLIKKINEYEMNSDELNDLEGLTWYEE